MVGIKTEPMDASEYLAFVPLLIYGIGLADLLGEWKRLLDKSQWFLPYALFTIILTEIAVYNIFIYVNLVYQLPGQSYFTYLSFLVPPFLFMLTTNAFTPDQGNNTKEYFLQKMPIIFTLLALFVGSHFFYSFNEGEGHTPYTRVLSIILILVAGYTRKISLIYAIGVLWLITIFMRGNIVSTAPGVSASKETNTIHISIPKNDI